MPPSVHVLHGIRSNANSLRAILPPPIPPRRVHRIWRHHFRFVLLAIALLLCISLSINAALFNFKICTDSKAEKTTNTTTIDDDGSTRRSEQQKQQRSQMHTFYNFGNIFIAVVVAFNGMWTANTITTFTAAECDHLVWAMALGTLLAAIPFLHFYSKFGARRVLFAAALLSAFSTTAGPFAAFIGFWPFAVVCVLQGIACAADFAALGMLCVHWAALDEYGLFLSAVASYGFVSLALGANYALLLSTLNFCSFFSSSSTTLLCSWPTACFGCSCLCLVFALLWFALYQDQPRACLNVSSRELQHIQAGKTAEHVDMDTMATTMEKAAPVPYMKIVCNPLVLVCCLNAFVVLLSGAFIVQYLISNTVIDGANYWLIWLTIAALFHIPSSISIGLASDRIMFISEWRKLIVCNCIGVGLPALNYLGIAFAPPHSTRMMALLFLYSVCILHSAVGASFYKCAMLISRQYGHVVIGGGIQLAKCLLVVLFTSSSSTTSSFMQLEWRNICLLLSCQCLLANLAFCWFATDQPASFTNTKRKLTMEEEGQQQQQMPIATNKRRNCTFYIGN